LASTRAVKIFVSPAKSYHTLTDSIVEQTYQGSNSITERRYFTYDNTKYFINSQTTYNSDGTSTINTYQHVSDLISSGSPIINQMWGVNDISPIISTTVTKADKPLFYTTNPYFNPSSGVYVPQNTQIQIGSNPVETREVYNAYDIYGNLLEKQKPGGGIEDYLWGYDYHYPVAKIVGTNIGTATITVNQSVLNNPASDAALRTELNKLRSLSNVLVTSYTYNQALGTITSETDPAGHSSFYNYDGMGRLSYIQDQDKNILKRFDYNYSGQPINNTIPAAYSNAGIPVTTFIKSPACAAGLITPTFFYSVPAGKYTSFADQATVDNLAQSDLNTNGQAGANALPCLTTMSCLNTTTMPYTIVFTNIATAAVYTFTINPSPSVVPLGNIPVGTYNVSMTPSGTTSAQLNFNGTTYTGSTFNLSSVSISNSNAFTIQPFNSGACSFTMASGYSSPTNGISSSGGVSNGYLIFYSGSSIVANTSYVVATIKGGCVPSATRSFNVTASGNTFAVTVSTSGQMTIKLTAGASSINANVTINFSSFSYAL
jgi:YD repeat-containing protein